MMALFDPKRIMSCGYDQTGGLNPDHSMLTSWQGHVFRVPFVTHYSDVIMVAMASQITSLTSAYSTVYSGADQRKHQSSASLAFVRGIHCWPVNSPHKWLVTRKMFPFDDVIIGNPPVICNGVLCSFVVNLNERLNERSIGMPVIGYA